MEPNKSRFRASNAVPRFKENETPTKPFLQKSTKKKPQFTVQRRQRSKLSSVHGISESKEKKGFQEFQKKMKKSDSKSKFAFDLNSVSIGKSSISNCTPVSGRVASVHESAIDDPVYERGSANTATDVKTPPVEASLSPEIQSQSQSKMVALKSVGTPVSYGAGHLLSGVSDKRKSRRRGSLKGGLEKSRYSGSSRVRNNVMFSPRKAIGFQGILDDESMPITSPQATYDCNGIALSEAKCFTKSMSRDDSGNFIHTPESGSSSDAEVRLSNSFRQEFDSITETLERVKLSPRSEISNSMWDATGLGSHSADIAPPPISLDPIRLQKDADCVSSWVSDTTSDDPTLSQMRMSWCEGLVSESAGTDEFDSCCLSDEQIDGDERVEEKETDQGNDCNHTIVASVVNKGNGFGIGDQLSPVLLDYEPCLIAEGKENSCRNNACAESICTDGGGLLASGDSDWTYFQENPLVSCHIEQFKEE